MQKKIISVRNIDEIIEELETKISQINNKQEQLINPKPINNTNKDENTKMKWWMIPLLAVVIPVGFVGLTLWMIYRIIKVQVVERLIDLIPRRNK